MRHRIKLRPAEVKDFVAAASKCEFDVDIAYNRYIVDAKSIVGVLGLDFNQVLTVSYSGYDANFEQFMNRFAVACQYSVKAALNGLNIVLSSGQVTGHGVNSNTDIEIWSNSSACNCALAARLAANELEQPGIRPFAAGKL